MNTLFNKTLLKAPITTLMTGLGEWCLLAILTLIAPLCVFIDVVVIGHGIPEISATELLQETLLAASMIVFGYNAWRHAHSRGFFTLAAGFFGCMLIRELDGIFDDIWHGFWVIPAVLTAVITLGYVILFCRDSVVKPLADFIDTKPYFHIMFGLIVVLVFSRVFGSRTVMLQHLDLSVTTSGTIKAAIQEGLELFGYIFIAYGSWLLARQTTISGFAKNK